ncbi:MAG TPA: hypothetical protein VLX68_00800 [Chitinivibrionales bacterium]|nr:hypothetical protein [Chitinivibrionales bacterium]
MRSCYAVLSTGFLLILGCLAPIKQFYPGAFFPKDRTYQNQPIGFSLSYRGNWDLITDPNNMKGHRSTVRTLHESGAELLFIGFTVEKTQATRGIVANLNETNREYAEQMQQINKNSKVQDYGLFDDTVYNVPMVRWEYSSGEFRFVEFFFTIDTYNLRIAFWTKPLLFKNFYPVYRDIMGTLTRIDRK